ncbi:uncharacterized protein SCODWIG_02930 [Saccharomycodes ludwigii]|uniref:AB hydrolase-1 domain-containing protein n=1 Tax=Saccharomycodes ludwigii TaxID=36035 RepID=A0A376B9C6_9ASCO|nr:hypothetical protein SCDLUD_003102 [Saccharomycodes ludwigii]KAH3900134.1 hypothetical protein SCDLUD_003102 [Saccharomycodes ludwigii]SSD61169.1 uncharacterized protein SCODWIG_02930 [Saccharomycodes ludwigii]
MSAGSATTVNNPPQQQPTSNSKLQVEDLENYGYKSAFKTWRNLKPPVKLEERILSFLSFYPPNKSKNSFKKAQILDVPIDENFNQLTGKQGKNNYIHEFYIENTLPRIQSDKAEMNGEDVVMVHGYGAALGLFLFNFEQLSNLPGIKLHALDLLGFGLSSRPPFPKKENSRSWYTFWNSGKGKGKEDSLQQGSILPTMKDVDNAESFFIDSLEAWRRERNVNKFILVGHSLGGYLSCCYALKYPQHVSKLVLISPVGVETSMFDLTRNDNNNNSNSKTVKILGPDVKQEIDIDTDKPANTDKIAQGGENTRASSSFHVPDSNGHVEKIPNVPKVLDFIWKQEISPFTLLRCMGPIGPLVSGRWSFRRFDHLGDPDKVMAMHEYTYGTFRLNGSGEYALTRLLGPGALAYHPLLSRVPGKIQCPSLWIYGDHDWMSKEAGEIIVNKINASPQNSDSDNTRAEFKIVKNAGHHVYLDNPTDFDSLLSTFLGY